MNELFYEEKSTAAKVLRFLVFALCFLIIASGMYIFYDILKIKSSGATSVKLLRVKTSLAEKGIKELAGRIKKIDAYVNSGYELVKVAEITRREPFLPFISQEEKLMPYTKKGKESEAVYKVEQPVEVIPPPMEVKGVFLSGGSEFVVLDFADKRGLLLKQGDKFDNGNGKVLKITDDKVILLWMGKKIVLNIGGVK